MVSNGLFPNHCPTPSSWCGFYLWLAEVQYGWNISWSSEGLWLGELERETCYRGQSVFPSAWPPPLELSSQHCDGQFTCLPLSSDVEPCTCLLLVMSPLPSKVPGIQKSSVLIYWINVYQSRNKWVNERLSSRLLPLVLGLVTLNMFLYPSVHPLHTY